MAEPITDPQLREFPLNQPEGWKPKIARYTLRLPDEVKELTIANIGIQSHNSTNPSSDAVAAIRDWAHNGPHRPVIVEELYVLLGRDEPNTHSFICYWTNANNAEESLKSLAPPQIRDRLSQESKESTGLWLEVFTPDVTRFETNYAGDDYQPGLAQLPGTKQVGHNLTGYWGAARDRIRASAYDKFEDPISDQASNSTVSPSPPSVSSSETGPDFDKATRGANLVGTNKTTIAHVRSGQFWENCSEDERQNYEDNLEPHLMNGLKDIYSRPSELGDYGLRFLRNIPRTPQEHERRETCASGFFRSLSDLEAWAKDCKSHHKIFGGALSHKNKFGDDYKFRTWHEVCVLRPGEARWEYVNCTPGTGTLPFQYSETK